jgi:hypothetical protein
MPFRGGMKPSGLAPFALLALLAAAVPAALHAQSDTASKGKIHDVERSADNATKGDRHRHGHDDDAGDDDGGGFFSSFIFQMLFYVPRDTGQGYLKYPYARSDGPSPFVLQDVYRGRSFGTFSGSYFRDGTSTLRGANFSIEWVGGALQRELDYTFYREPTPSGTDYLHLFRVGVAGLPPAGDIGYFRIGLGLQALVLDDGDAAAGPELELGMQLFPARPLGIGGTARLAPLTWEGGPVFGTGFVDLAGHGSVFLGRAELMLGWRWTRVGVGAPFSGPTAGMKVWF